MVISGPVVPWEILMAVHDSPLSGEDFRNFFEQGPEAILLADPDTLVVCDVNRSFLDLLGFPSRNEIVGESVFLFSPGHETELREAVSRLSQSESSSLTVRRMFMNAVGQSLPVECFLSVSHLPGGRGVLVGHVRDLTREWEVEKLNRIYLELDRQILAGEDLESLMGVVVERLVNEFGIALSYISVPEKDGTIRYLVIRSENPHCARLLEEETRSLTWNSAPGNQRVSSKVLFSRRAAFVITEDVRDSPMRDWYLKQGIDASLVIPLLGGSEENLPWGTMTVSVRDRHFFPEYRRQLFLEFSERLRVAFAHYDEHKRIRLFREAMESGRAPSLIVNPDGTIAWFNRAFAEMARMDPTKISGAGLGSFFPFSELPLKNATSPTPMGPDEAVSGEWFGITGDGNSFLAEALVSSILDDRMRLTHFLVHMKDITSEREKEKEIYRLAHQDPLTGLLNRNGFMDQFRQEVEKAAHSGHLLALGFLDLDGFKELNDTMGHAAGDQFLEKIGRRMSEMVEGKGILGRIGGDEFVLLITEKDGISDFERIFFHLLEQVSRPVKLEEGQFQTTVSVGVAIYPRDADSVEELLRKADLTMYYAKARGKNTIRFFESAIEQDVREWYEKGTALRQAIVRKEFELYFQPQVDIRDNRLVGAEALIRWNRPNQGVMLPGSFIPLAEETGLIHPVGDWVLEEGLSLLARWVENDFPPCNLAINISARQFHSDGFWSDIESRMDRFPGAASRLSLELTESLLMGDPALSAGRISSLRSRGVTFVVDDFGTGYSSLSYLTRLPVDAIKIPQAFVLRMKESVRDRKMVEIIANMARSLDLTLIGEGAETPVELRMLRDLGCFVIQGFAISRPLSVSEFEEYLRRHRSRH